jgi:hypothetical protein
MQGTLVLRHGHAATARHGRKAWPLFFFLLVTAVSALYAVSGGAAALRTWPLNLDPLDFIEGDRVASTIVELGRLRAFVRGHSLRVL